jgi:hypothetical protein
MNKDAGRGNWLFVTLRLESGEELPFFVDTGMTLSVFDKSLTHKLGQRLGTATINQFGITREGGIYAAPRLYLGGAPLITAKKAVIDDLSRLSLLSGHPIKGILGMDCLRHYCIQLDFQAGKVRFLDGGHLDTVPLGQVFPLTFHWGCPFIQAMNIAGRAVTNLQVDVGYAKDAALALQTFREKVAERTLRVQGEIVHGRKFERAWMADCVWNGGSYDNLIVGNESDLLGLRFLARHLVTFDFPNRTLYLKQTSAGPLVDEDAEAALKFLTNLSQKSPLPGWSGEDDRPIDLEASPDAQTYDFRKSDGSMTTHYRVRRAAINRPWKLQKAWRTDENDRFREEYPLD